MRILVAEDRVTIARSVRTLLAAQHYAIDFAPDGQVAWSFIDTYEYDLLIVDEVLPLLDGVSLCRQVRHSGKQMPILLIAQQNDVHQKSIGLDAGADDCMVQPLDGEELVARVRALLRRSQTATSPILTWGNLQLESSSRSVIFESKLLNLTPKEYALLELLMHDRFTNTSGDIHRVFSYGTIIEHLWVGDHNPSEETVRTHMKGLRHKLKAAGMNTDPIETVYGVGYRLRPAPAPPAIDPAAQPQLSILVADPNPQTAAALTAVVQPVGVNIQPVSDLPSLRSSIDPRATAQTQILLLELALVPNLTAAGQLLAEIEQISPHLPVIIWSSWTNLATRLMVANSPAHYFLAKPNSVEFVWEIVQKVASQKIVTEWKILVLHNDTSTLMSLHQALEPGNCHLTSLQQPQLLWSTLASSHPNLVIVDLNLLDVGGLEICQMLRQDANWHNIPIIAITDQTDGQHIQKFFAMGANDLLIKPIVKPEIILSCVRRILFQHY